MKIMISDICEAFKSKAVGSKVDKAHKAEFMKALENAIKKHDWSKDRVKGQTVLDLPRTVNKMVSPGSWYRSDCKEDYVVREFRGSVGLYRRRPYGVGSQHVRCVIYSRDAYRNDPDYDFEQAIQLCHFFGEKEDGYVLVAVLGDPDKKPSTVSFSRFVKNLAGANNEYKKMSKADIVDLAQKVDDYRKNYVGVSD